MNDRLIASVAAMTVIPAEEGEVALIVPYDPRLRTRHGLLLREPVTFQSLEPLRATL